VHQVIRMVGLENVMVHKRVSFEGIAEKFHQEGTVHQITVQQPLEQGAENGSSHNSNGAPKKEHHHKTNLNFLF